ncbi:hypothetical protein ABFZ85_14640 [Hyphococcus formosus]|uniref:hypothetical protein n=1 Tax=Hyphococcus formosus TaxID=3143534 RepID=UPI00398A7CA0
MTKYVYVLAFLMCTSLYGATAGAQSLLFDDFENSDAEDWVAQPGRGDVRLTEYSGNISMRLTRNAAAFRQVSLGAAERVIVSAFFAASDLEGEDACILEFTTDEKTWVEIGRIADGQDDGTTLHAVHRTVNIETNDPSAYIGVRIKGNADNDTCWVDNITVDATSGKVASSIASDAFLNGQVSPEPYSTAAFAPPKSFGPPTDRLQGILRITGGPADHFRLLKDEFGYVAESKTIRAIPSVAISFVQHGNEFIPTIRGPQLSNHPDWEWIIEPGKIWRDPDGVFQLRFPFALQERNANCIHNGLAALQISNNGDVGNLVYQIGSETCAYTQFDMWGANKASIEKTPISNTQDIIDAYRDEIRSRLATLPITELDDLETGEFGSPIEVPPQSMTVFGYVENGMHYVSECPTRYGPYPFCEVIDLPSYSFAKSIIAGLASMRLEKLYPGAMASLVADYVPECSGSEWSGVTFSDALNMATGIYNSDEYDVDEASPEMRAFFLAETHADKIAIACSSFERRSDPGEKFVYRTGDTYILGTAINAFLREQTQNQSADFYEELLVPVFKRIGTSPLLLNTRRTLGPERQPFTGWGMTMHRNDIALIADFIQNGGVVDGEAFLDEGMLSAALQGTSLDRGLPAVIPEQRYKNGFWAWNAGHALGCAGEIWIPAMSGYGGLSAALMPNGSTYYYFSDGGAFAWRRAAQASNERQPFCETSNDK